MRGTLFNACHFNHGIVENDYVGERDIYVGIGSMDASNVL